MKAWHILLLAFVLLSCLTYTAAFPEKLQQEEGEYREEEIDEEEEEKRPYSFAWTAARHYNGAPDREQQESRGQDGVTRGVFRYVDPRHQVQEIVYYSDDEGFHVDASNLPQDTVAVQSAKSRHTALFEKIRQEHLRIAAERGQLESRENHDTKNYNE
ncbi:hypothetical protein Pmani_001678 [Petrolisthes manimaculis]|uniref:Uncharacterized protein n=1 Tax=Petrolisthes manimaculis TaxID=1843537 RepID=A0AAE1QJI4_9EUCA|nr:hypothetical protein Pmani_001678 [Petrolisthes manimaculis]